MFLSFFLLYFIVFQCLLFDTYSDVLFVLFLICIAKPTITVVKSNNSAIGEIYQTLDNKTPT